LGARYYAEMLKLAQEVLAGQPDLMLEIRRDRGQQRHVVLPQEDSPMAFCGTPVIRPAKKQLRVWKKRGELARQPYLCVRCLEQIGKSV
jgi:hypothetical protein